MVFPLSLDGRKEELPVKMEVGNGHRLVEVEGATVVRPPMTMTTAAILCHLGVGEPNRLP